jgi:hypothetical protein
VCHLQRDRERLADGRQAAPPGARTRPLTGMTLAFVGLAMMGLEFALVARFETRRP